MNTSRACAFVTMAVIMLNTNKNCAEIRVVSADNTVTWQTKQSQANITNTSFKYLQGFSTVFDKPVKRVLSTKKTELRNTFLVFSSVLQSAHNIKVLTSFLNQKIPFLG